MTTRRVAGLAVLMCLTAALAWIFWSRGIPGGLSGQVVELKTPYKSEREWAVTQIAADINEMGAFANQRPARAFDAGRQPPTPWEPSAFRPIADAALGGVPAASSLTEAGAPELYESLTALDVRTIAGAAHTVSKSLAANMRNARAHESAALVLGAFALREAADWFTDVRWPLNRMTAHLAVAATLRNGEAGSPDGALAHVILRVLSNHQARAAAQLAALGQGSPPEPLNAWVRALTMRITQDWRLLPDPATATRLEKLEYFRARRATVRRRRALEELSKVGEPVAADFARIAQDSFLGVEDSNAMIPSAIERELTEAAEAHQLVQGRPMPNELSAALNQRATRLVTTTPQVLPWGAWAEYYQRHIAMSIGMVDSHYRVMQGSVDDAERAKADLDRQLGQLTWFPLGTLRRTKGSAATEADMTHVLRVVDLAAAAPEIVTHRAWVFFAAGSQAEPVPRAMPKAAAWFAVPTPEMPFEAGFRHVQGLRIAGPTLGAVIETAPTDRALLVAAAAGSPADPAVARARGLLEQRHDYDITAIDTTLSSARTEEERAVLQRKACVLSSRDCSALAATLAYLGDQAGAAAEYERAFADPEMDGVALAADAAWLVDYYYRNRRVADATALAERAAGTGSANGRRIRGLLFERIGRLDDAEEDFAAIAAGYENPAPLLGFYYRRVEIAGDQAYAQKWLKWRAETFPKGLQPEPAAMTETPKAGVFVYKDSLRSRKAGLRAGDIIVGLEGWRVDNLAQYYAINSFSDAPRMKLTIWRGALLKIEADIPNRLFGTELQTHPMKGWIQ